VQEEKMSLPRAIALVVGLAAVIATLSFVLTGAPVQTRRSQECVICRTHVDSFAIFGILRRVHTNDSSVAAYFRHRGFSHRHVFWQRANVSYNLFRVPCRTANLPRHPLLGLPPDLQLKFLTNSLQVDAILATCLAATNEIAAATLREQIEDWTRLNSPEDAVE
jgi:hypothetical protein